jgi:hypothetical protein
MKFLKVIYISIGLLFIIILVGCDSLQKGSKKPVRLKEPRIAPLTESQWNEEQIKVLTPYTREDGSVLNVVATLGRHPKLFDRFITRERRKAPCFSNGDIRRLPQSNSSL